MLKGPKEIKIGFGVKVCKKLNIVKFKILLVSLVLLANSVF